MRPPLWTPLVEESQPSGLSGPYAHAPCWLKVSLSLKLRCRAPQLPPAVLFGQKIGQGRKLVKKVNILKQTVNLGAGKPPEAAAGHNTLVLRTKTLLASMAHGHTDRTSQRAEIPPPEESTKGGGRERREAPPPLVEESQPSGLSGPYTHAPC